MASKKTSRSPKTAPPAQPAAEAKKTPSPAPKAAAGRAPKKTTAAKPAGGGVTPRKRPAGAASSAPDAGRPAMVVSDEDIRIRAYFLSLEYLGTDRNDVDFWLLAERELRPTGESED